MAHDFFLERGDKVDILNIADGYDPTSEVQKWLNSDIVVLQVPINWFSAPWIWKKYEDEVFNEGLLTKQFLTGDGRSRSDVAKPYGSGGLMAPRKTLICATWNAPQNAFENSENPVFQGRSMEDTLSDITNVFRFCGMEVLPSYGIFDIFKNPNISDDLAEYKAHLAKYC